MKLTFKDGYWIALSAYEERSIPKAAGFAWSYLVPDRWATADRKKAATLRDFADEAALAELGIPTDVLTTKQGGIPVPSGKSYYPYQAEGIRFILNRPNTLLADEPGLGKTIQAIGVVNADPSIQRVLVVCPASACVNWVNEFKSWGTRNLQVGWVGQKKLLDVLSVNVVVISFGKLKSYHTELRRKEWDLLIVDESHLIKNEKSDRTCEVVGKWDRKSRKMTVAPIRAKQRLFMTGTPILNCPAELWTTLHALDPKTWPSFWTFVRRYCDATKTRYGWDFSGASNLDELGKILRSTIMLRRTEDKVLPELPAMRRQVIELPAFVAPGIAEAELTFISKHTDLVDALTMAVRSAPELESIETFWSRVEALVKGTSIAFEETSKMRHSTAVAKIPCVIEHLKGLIDAGKKIVCFAHHKQVIKEISEAFGDVCVTLDGSTGVGKRQDLVDRFQTDDSIRLLVGSMTAAGICITLTAATIAVFAELDWVPAVVTQCEKRLHRIGQRYSVLVQHLAVEGTLDATMAHTVVRKQKVMDRMLRDDKAM